MLLESSFAPFLPRKISSVQLKRNAAFRPLNPEKLLRINPPCTCPDALWWREQGLEGGGKAIRDALFAYELNSSFALQILVFIEFSAAVCSCPGHACVTAPLSAFLRFFFCLRLE